MFYPKTSFAVGMTALALALPPMGARAETAAQTTDNIIDYADTYSPNANNPTDPTETYLYDGNLSGTIISGGYTTNSFTAQINNHTIVITTDAQNFTSINSSSHLTVTVDGKAVLSNQAVTTIRFQDECNIDIALGGSGACPGVPDSLLGALVAPALTSQGTAAAVTTNLSAQVTRGQTQILTRILEARLSQVFQAPRLSQRQAAGTSDRGFAVTRSQGISGISAGDDIQHFSLWATGSSSFLNNDNPLTKSHGTTEMILLGGDYTFGSFALGFAGTVDNSQLKTTFNTGKFGQHGFSFSPYAAYSLWDGKVVFDAFGNLGHAHNDYSQPLLAAGYNSDRTIVGTHATYADQVESLDYSAKLGYTISWDHHRAYTDSLGAGFGDTTAHVGELSFGGKVGYTIDPVRPYIGLTYLYDVSASNTNATSNAAGNPLTPANGTSEMDLTAGLDVYTSDSGTLSLEVLHGFFRKDESTTNLMANFRIQL